MTGKLCSSQSNTRILNWRAYGEGCAAANNGQPIEDNPHDETGNPVAYKDWNDGYIGANQECCKVPCFRVISAVIGDPNPENVVICFNESPENCSTITIWDFYSNGVLLNDTSFLNPVGGQCLAFRATRIIDGDGPSDQDLITLDYTPGNCAKLGDAGCSLEAFADRVVENRILGISSMKVGNVANNIIDIEMTAEAATTGSNWDVKINGGIVGISAFNIVGGNIQLTISTTPGAGDTVTVNHYDVAGGATAVDGRILYQFEDYAVQNEI